MRNGAKVLIVDDDKSSCQMLSEVVKRMGLKPIVTQKAVDALNIVKLQVVHAALVDVLLPKMGGVDLVAEFRKTKFGDNPVVLVSGVFKDKAFAAEAVKKTGAADFLFKPFGAEDLMNCLKVAFKEALSDEKWNVQSLLTRTLPTPRDRARAIEHLDSIQGSDFLFVLSLLLEGSVSGHLNIVNEAGEIFGVTVTNGTITDVDSTESQSAGVLALISKGFLNQQDWDEFQAAGNKKFTLERLVQEGYVSPHAVALAKSEQILADLKSICAGETLRVNFGLADTEDTPAKHAVEMSQLVASVMAAPDEYLRPDHLKSFYSPVLNVPIRAALPPSKLEAFWRDPLFNGFERVKDVIGGGGTIQDILGAGSLEESSVLRAMHFLVLNRAIVFDDVSRAKDLSSSLERYRKIHADLSTRTPDEVFEYFGAPPMASVKHVESLFDQYSKSNSPDSIPAGASEELKALAQKCFSIIKNARDAMVDETRRLELMEKKKSMNAGKQKRSHELAFQGLELLRRGQAVQALEVLKEAEALYSSTLTFLIRIWADLKAKGGRVDGKDLIPTLRKLDSLPPEERKSAYYFMVMGLVKRALNDPMAASYFEKAIAADGTLTEARRELRALEGSKGAEKDKKVDLLTGDISSVISQLFKRKAD